MKAKQLVTRRTQSPRDSMKTESTSRDNLSSATPGGHMSTSAKERYCLSILRKYNVLVDFKGVPAYKTVPEPLLEGTKETVAKWIKRVLGDEVYDVVFFTTEAVYGGTSISTLRQKGAPDHLKGILRQTTKGLSERFERIYSTLPRDDLEDLIANEGETLDQAVKDHFKRFLEKSGPDVPATDLIRELVIRYNAAVQQRRN